MSATDRLGVRWSKREADILISFPNKPDGHWLYGWVSFIRNQGKTFAEQLAERGYDIKTLRITVEKDASHPRWKR